MGKKMLALPLLLLALTLIISACGDNGPTTEPADSEPDAAITGEEQTGDTNTDNPPEQEKDLDSENEKDANPADGEQPPSKDDVDRSGESNDHLPEMIAVDEQLSHEKGTVLTVERISFDEELITIDFTAINGTDGGDVYLADGGRQGAVLEDDTGFSYQFLPPEDNEDLKIAAGERLSGSLVFIGRLKEDATSLQLTFNPDNDLTDAPQFTLESIEIER